MMTPRETWADPRIDDLNKKVDEGFKKMDTGFEKAEARMDAGFKRADKKMEAGFAKVDADIRELRGDMSSLRTELLAAAIILAALVGLIGAAIF